MVLLLSTVELLTLFTEGRNECIKADNMMKIIHVQYKPRMLVLDFFWMTEFYVPKHFEMLIKNTSFQLEGDS